MRTNQRQKDLGEVFTPPKLCREILGKLPGQKSIWKDPEKTWLDPSCGNGNFLFEIKKRLMRNGHAEEHILEEMIFGADIMPDNIKECIERLYGPGTIRRLSGIKIPAKMKADGLISVFTHNGKLIRNIVCADGLVYDYSFGRPKDNPEGWDVTGILSF